MTAVTRLLGRLYPPHCPVCRLSPGPDCPDKGRTRRQAKRAEERQTRREIDSELSRFRP